SYILAQPSWQAILKHYLFFSLVIFSDNLVCSLSSFKFFLQSPQTFWLNLALEISLLRTNLKLEIKGRNKSTNKSYNSCCSLSSKPFKNSKFSSVNSILISKIFIFIL